MIRRAVPADLGELLPLIRGFYRADGHRYDERLVRAGLTPLLADARHGIVLVTDDLTGYAVLTWGWSLESGGREALLDEIYVAVRGRGSGTELLAASVEAAAAEGAKALFLETERRNERGRRFYVRHGFRIEESVWLRRDLTDPQAGG